MRRITKREGAAELTRNIYLDLEIAIPTLFGRDDRATYHKIYYNAQAIKNRWFSQLVALRILQRRRYLVHFEVPTASHRSDFHRLWRRVAVVWPSSADSTRVVIPLWVERKTNNYYGKQTKKIFKKMRNNNCFWARRGPCAPRLERSHV